MKNESMKVNVVDNEHNDNGWEKEKLAATMKNISDNWTPSSVETMYTVK